MTYRQVRFHDLLHHLRRKYEGDKEKNDLLNHIVWYSYPIAFPYDSSTKAEKVRQARASQKYRCNKRLKQMAKEYSRLFFVTLTFRDEVLEKTSDRTRHRYVSSFLNAETLDYVANVDYGSKTNREHYHAVVALEDGKTLQQWQYGFASAKKVKLSTISKARGFCKLSKYMTKLTNHASKLTAGRVFSKVKKKPDQYTLQRYGGTVPDFKELSLDEELPF